MNTATYAGINRAAFRNFGAPAWMKAQYAAQIEAEFAAADALAAEVALAEELAAQIVE